jgi:hypothetical protein
MVYNYKCCPGRMHCILLSMKWEEDVEMVASSRLIRE